MKAEYVDHMGTDLSVVNAARVSFDKVSDWVVDTDWGGEDCRCVELNLDTCDFSCFRETKRLSDADARLIRYLAAHDHWTPFAHTSITLRMQAPVPIRTQCFKHKAGFVENEESRRYVSGRPELFVPESFRAAPEGSIKQGSGATHELSDYYLDRYQRTCLSAISEYEEMIADGVCPEQARFVLPQGVEVQWIWTGNLASYARFYGLRTDPHAQREIQDLARAVGDIIEPLFPVSWAALAPPANP